MEAEKPLTIKAVKTTRKIFVRRGRKKVYRGFITLLTELHGPRKRVRNGYGEIRVGRKLWRVVVVSEGLKVWGYFDHNLNMLVISGDADTSDLLDTLLHEASHGLAPKRAEKTILQQGNVLVGLVSAFGFQLND